VLHRKANRLRRLTTSSTLSSKKSKTTSKLLVGRLTAFRQ
jgi:hypothetical protein